MNTRNWTPVRKGDAYCSPACGANCTYEKYTEAVELAQKLKKRCELEIGGEWSIDVRENLGWHWSVYHSKTNISINYGGYLSKGKEFTVGLRHGTPIQISTHPQTFNTPKDAWDKQIETIKKEFYKYQTILINAKVY